ncbi:10364_t:CDS:2 [Diversispora eburnea]|uniref:10364_t:CDS:1 n=1 Tax=Diversispora eburnea TaxID=1213867 RepID=A0A9N8W0I0_9GLOM|nr:10364_t:CDS:2 [Diversispora eburnea]
MEEPEDILEDIIEEPENEINDILTFFKKKSRKICKGIWYKSPINKIKIIIARGNHLHNMGHSINGQIWLYPEEALFLLERGMLSIEFQDVPISIQQAYMLMLTGDEFITLEKYQINPIVEPGSCDTYGLMANEEDNQEDYKIDFYVHNQSQDKKFKKKSPGEPLLRVVVASAMLQKPPSIKTLERLFKDNGSNLSAKKNNSILFSIVDGENVVFLEFKDIMFGDIKVDLVK